MNTTMEFITLHNQHEKQIIDGVVLHPLKINKDESGVLVETLRVDWEGIYGKEREFKMQYYSITPSGLARDEDVWHYHPTVQEDRILLVKGAVILAVADKREGSKTLGLLNLFHMESDNNPYIVLVPKATLHGFLVVSKEEAIMLNFPTSLYNPKEEARISYEEAGVQFSDGSPFAWDRIRNAFAE